MTFSKRKAIQAVVLLCAVIPLAAFAGGIATDVQITDISNTTGNAAKFQVWTSAGDGSHDCEGVVVTFQLAKAGTSGNDERVHDRAFAIALAAYTTGKNVQINTYSSGQVCADAAYIKLLQ